MPERLSTSKITEENKGILQGIATDLELWTDYLNVVAEHTGRNRRRTAAGEYEPMDNQSALNCAAIQASSYEDTREVLTADEWKRLFPDSSIKAGMPGIPVVKASSTGKYLMAARLFPPEAVDGLPEDRFHNYPERIDLRDDVDAACWNASVSGALTVPRTRLDENGNRVFENGRPVRDPVEVGFDELDPNTAHIVRAHYGIPDPEGAKPQLPPDEIVDNLSALKAYCDQIRNDASSLLFQIDRSFKQEREAVLGIGEKALEEPSLEVDAAHERSTGRSNVASTPSGGEAPLTRSETAEPYVAAGMAPWDVAKAARSSASRTADTAQADGNPMSVRP